MRGEPLFPLRGEKWEVRGEIVLEDGLHHGERKTLSHCHFERSEESFFSCYFCRLARFDRLRPQNDIALGNFVAMTHLTSHSSISGWFILQWFNLNGVQDLLDLVSREYRRRALLVTGFGVDV